jgi:hypothetical protein
VKPGSATAKQRQRIARRLETCAYKLQDTIELAQEAGITGIMVLHEQRVFELMEAAQTLRDYEQRS